MENENGNGGKRILDIYIRSDEKQIDPHEAKDETVGAAES
jgi:hypothetical protein